MSDQDAIQGGWKIDAYYCFGDEAGESATHIFFGPNTFARLASHFLDQGLAPSTYRMDTERRNLVLSETRKGLPPLVLHGLYRLEGDRLELCLEDNGEFPPEFSRNSSGFYELSRETGPLPQMRKPSGRAAIDDAILGRLTFDDLSGRYFGTIRYRAAWYHVRRTTLQLRLSPDGNGDFAAALTRARALVSRLGERIRSARDFAAAELLALKNSDWLDEGESPVTSSAFRSRLVPSALDISADGNATLYFDDGGLFAGHSVALEMDAQDRWVDADIPG